jgi:hypothetical protein
MPYSVFFLFRVVEVSELGMNEAFNDGVECGVTGSVSHVVFAAIIYSS